MSFGFPTFSQNRFTEQYSGLCPIAPGRGAGLQPCRRDCPVARWLVAQPDIAATEVAQPHVRADDPDRGIEARDQVVGDAPVEQAQQSHTQARDSQTAEGIRRGGGGVP
ncbi:predicted protein [Mycobacterium tuberculosis GM 1503]|nr:predicted protein [Mycobacterium tuberculosis GM 1503]